MSLTKQRSIIIVVLHLLLALLVIIREPGIAKEKAEKNREKKSSVKIEGLVFVKGGCFEMGDIWGDGGEDERPVHTVCVDDYYIGKHEVTQKEWVAIMGENPSYEECDNCPVYNVNWHEVQTYLERLREKTNVNYRLPTEAEWEYAARSGGKKEKWAGINDESQLGKYAWYRDNSEKKPHSVGTKKPNGLGLYDMTGNVWEWVWDWYDKDYYKNSPGNNPDGPETGKWRVLRGGSRIGRAEDVRMSRRNADPPESNYGNYPGFRIAFSPE